MFWTYKLNFDVDIFDIFWLGNCFGYFLQKLGDFLYQSFGHTALDALEVKGSNPTEKNVS
jgi:hypothetical protein